MFDTDFLYMLILIYRKDVSNMKSKEVLELFQITKPTLTKFAPLLLNETLF